MSPFAAIASTFILISLANAAPVVARAVLHERFNQPLDRGLTLADGQRLLGRSKTWRGLAAALGAAALGAPLLGLSWSTGLLVAAAAMAGDLLSSFVKRRRGLAPSSRAAGLDQIPEALLPALAAMPLIGLGWWGVIVVTALFTAANIYLSPLLHRLGIRRRPY